MCKFGVFFRNALVLALIVLMLCFPASAALLSLSAQSAILINASSCEVIFEYNANEKRGMASTTKIMTAIVAIENSDLDQKYTIPDDAVGVEGSSLYLKSGETMTMRDLLTGLLLQSANDAAEAIAIIVGGSVEGFAEMMNKKAAELGLSHTHFTNPHGLSDTDHYTTAHELALITAYALKNETFKSICSLTKASLPGTDHPRVVKNHNKLLLSYSGAYGVKTGFTKATGRCLVSAAERNGVELISVTLNAPDDWNDHSTMLDYGFSLYENVKLADSGTVVYKLPIIGGDIDNVALYIKEDINVCLKKKRGSIIERLELIYPRFAPVYKDDILGRIVYYLNDIEIASSPILATEYVGIKN